MATRDTLPARNLRLVYSLLLCTAWLALSLTPAGARADNANVPATYRQLVDEALREYKAEQFERAHALFLEAHRMWPNARTLRGLGRVAFELQRYQDTIDYLEQAQASSTQPLDLNLRQEAKELQRKAREALAQAAAEPTASDNVWHVEAVEQPAPREKVVTFMLRQPAPPASERPAWLLPTGLSLSFVGALGAGFGAATYAAYLDNGSKLRVHDTPHYRERWQDSRDRALLFSGIGLGVLSLGAAALAPSIPPRERRWLTPVLLATGSAALISGLALIAANGCTREASETLSSCTSKTERSDAGALLAMLSAPLLSMPLTYAVEWLTQD